MKGKKYLRYKGMKNSLEGIVFKGYPLEMVLGSYLATYAWSKWTRKPLLVFGLLVARPKIPLFSYKSTKKLVTYSSSRADYIKLLDRYVSHHDCDVVFLGKDKALTRLSLSSLMSLLAIIAKNRSLIFRPVLCAHVIFAIATIKRLEKMSIEVREYTSFNSAYRIESFLSYYFRIRGVKTQSLQHGMYFEYLNEPPIDVINYENVCAETLLVWGEYTKEQVSNYLPKGVNVKVYGYPYCNDRVSVKSADDSEALVLMLPRPIYKREALEVLSDFINSYEGELIVRAHPNSVGFVSDFLNAIGKSSILSESGSLQDFLGACKFRLCVGFNSTAVFEAILYDQKVCVITCGNDEFNLSNVASAESASMCVLMADSQPDLDKNFFFGKFKGQI